MKTTLRDLIQWGCHKGRIPCLITILVCATSCSTTMLTDYLPKSDLGIVAAETIVRRAFEEQPWEYRPNEISFSDDALRLTVIRYQIDGNFVRMPVGTLPITIYYSSLGKAGVVCRRSRFIVTLRNKRGEVLRKVFLPDETEAKCFLDALESLRIRSAASAPK